MGGAETPQGKECGMCTKVGVNVSQCFLFKPTASEPSEEVIVPWLPSSSREC